MLSVAVYLIKHDRSLSLLSLNHSTGKENPSLKLSFQISALHGSLHGKDRNSERKYTSYQRDRQKFSLHLIQIGLVNRSGKAWWGRHSVLMNRKMGLNFFTGGISMGMRILAPNETKGMRFSEQWEEVISNQTTPGSNNPVQLNWRIGRKKP